MGNKVENLKNAIRLRHALRYGYTVTRIAVSRLPNGEVFDIGVDIGGVSVVAVVSMRQLPDTNLQQCTTCKFYANSPHLICAVRPSGPGDCCSDFELK